MIRKMYFTRNLVNVSSFIPGIGRLSRIRWFIKCDTRLLLNIANNGLDIDLEANHRLISAVKTLKIVLGH